MSLYGMMRTSVSGMQAQANRLSAVADNIANSDTTGFKRYSAEFSQLVRPGVQSIYTAAVSSGGVLTDTRQAISLQGTLSYTSSVTDLAIDGNGFFIVQDQNNTPFMTRSGSFVPNGDGELVNSSGLKLAGYGLDSGAAAPVANGFAGLENVSIANADLIAAPTTQGTFQANLPSQTPISGGPLPSGNTATATFDQKTSLVVYDNLGEEKLVDVYFTKTVANEWEVAVFDKDDAASTGFPYASGPLTTSTLSFNPADGKLPGASDITFTVPNGAAATIDLSDMSQLAADYAVLTAEVDGNAPSAVVQVDIDAQGTLFARYADGSFKAIYQIPLATVTSPDQLIGQTGSIFVESAGSGDVQIGFPGEAGRGAIVSSALEQSNVDLADELTTMIQSQRGYTANSKVFQTGSELMDVLVNLKR
ncbi:MAG: flagellar hook protein FlgE [Pseudomonadota bacterium]